MTPARDHSDHRREAKPQASRYDRLLASVLKPVRLVSGSMRTIREFEDSLGFPGRVLRRIRQMVVVPALCALPLYVLVSAGSVSSHDVRSVLEVVEIEGVSGPPQTILYRVDPSTGTARPLPECEDEYIAAQFGISKYGDNVIIVNAFGEMIKPLLLATEWTLNIFFDVTLPSTVQKYIDIVKQPEFAQRKITDLTEYAMDHTTGVGLMKAILAERSFIEPCASQIVRGVKSGEYICPVTRVVVADTVVMGAGFRSLCLASPDDEEARIRPTSEVGFWTHVKTSLGVLRKH